MIYDMVVYWKKSICQGVHIALTVYLLLLRVCYNQSNEKINQNRMKHVLSILTTSVLFFCIAVSANAISVNTLNCSFIDTNDGNTNDWQQVKQWLVNNDAADIVGTTYYLDADTEEWTTTEPEAYVISMNMDKWADLTKMKTCNTGDYIKFMMVHTNPMFSYYDHQVGAFFESYVPTADGTWVDYPADWNYWMAWKMQKADETGAITYFAANVGVSAGSPMQHDGGPDLYIYEESEDVEYDEASFDPFTDTQLATVAVSDEPEGPEEDWECDGETCTLANRDDYAVSDIELQAFEVKQGITKLFKHADFSHTDIVRMSVAMINEDTLGATGEGYGSATVDESESALYKFSKRGVRKVGKVKGTLKKKHVRLKWNAFKNKKRYQVRIYNVASGKLVKNVKGVVKKKKTVKGLKSGTEYRAVVRAKKKNGKFSAWSSGYKFTTK